METDDDGNPLLSQFSEDGFVDCVLRIVDLTETDSHYTFRMLASYNGQVVGCDVRVLRGIRAGFDADMHAANFYSEGVVFSRSGVESDRLIAAIAELYGEPQSSEWMTDRESFTAIALHQGTIDFAYEAIKLKIFGCDSRESKPEDYYESFFNLVLAEGFVYWNEKDQEYRKPLIRGLSA
jgi:hypothetical protein